MQQCYGITTKGNRCKIRSNDKFCHYHIYQSSLATSGDLKSSGRLKITSPSKPVTSGYIYIYTLAKFFDKPTNWFKVYNLPGNKNKNDYEISKSPYIFLKIGMTSKDIQQRILQWEKKCKHDIILINPATDKIIKSSRLHDWFKRLSLTSTTGELDHFKDGGFFSNHDLPTIESEVHEILHKKYGKGIIYCKNCSNDSYNIHIEWFLIPKKDLNNVYKLINNVCKKYS